VVLLLRRRAGFLLKNHAWARGSPLWAVAGPSGPSATVLSRGLLWAVGLI
jgi:hypothetical protein